MSIFKDCDIRGVYGSEITARDAYLTGRGLGTMLPGGAVFRVGGDVRLSTPELKEALIRGLTESGVKVEDLGTVPTPALYYALANSNADGGATVTASHNPPKYNGIKFMLGREPVTRVVMDRLKEIIDGGKFSEGQGSVEKIDVLTGYIEALKKRFSAGRKLNVVIDAGNGAMSSVAPAALRNAGYDVTELFCEADGSFPNRDPNPAEYKHLSALCGKVVETGADFGVAFDGDGDRAVFVDEKGRAVINEKSLVLFIRKVLAGRPTPVVYDQKSSSVIRKATLAMGGEPMPERSGHAFIKKRFLEVGAAMAGEVSGHFFFGELGYDDGLFAALMMAEILCESDEPLSALVDEIVCPPITPDLRVACAYGDQQAWLDKVEEFALSQPCTIARLDGVRLEYEDGWVLMRKSVTAEQITLRAEAETAGRLKELLYMVADVLPEAVREVVDSARI